MGNESGLSFCLRCSVSVPCLCNLTSALSKSTCKRSWVSNISTVSDIHLESDRHLTWNRLFGRRETHPVLPTFSSLGHEARHRRWLLPQIHLRAPSWKRAFALRNRWPPARPYTAHRNRPQDPREASNQTRLCFFRPHPTEAVEACPFTNDPRTERGLSGQS